jgi:ribonuclease HI
MATKKYYVVWQGRERGIFETWDECKQQVHGFEKAAYKSFPTLAEARHAFQNQVPNTTSNKTKKESDKNTAKISSHTKQGKPIVPSLAVDAACSGNPGAMEYRGVDTATGKQLFHYGVAPLGTNNIGEFLAIVHGLAFLQKKGLATTPIYSDSVNAIKWVKQKNARTTLERNAKTATLFDMIDRAIAWLQNNSYQNPILKWETEIWGECPADFGRK